MLIRRLPINSPPRGVNADDADFTFKRFCFVYFGKRNLLKSLLAFILVGSASLAMAQARPTASRLTTFQVGALFVNGNSDYARSRFNGYGIYADADFRHGFGAEIAFHYITDQDQNTNVYERTYEAGGRYSKSYGRLQPYVKLLYGRGVLNYPYNTANLAYNMGVLGAGTDIKVTRHIYGRVDYEYQKWFGFSRDGSPGTNNDSLTPNLLSGGIGYRF